MRTASKNVGLVIEEYEDLLYNRPLEAKKDQDEYRQYAEIFQSKIKEYICYLEQGQICCGKEYVELYLKKDSNIFYKILKYFRIKRLYNKLETISVELEVIREYNEKLNAILHRFEQFKYFK